MFIICDKCVMEDLKKLGFVLINSNISFCTFRYNDDYRTISSEIKKKCKIVDNIKINF